MTTTMYKIITNICLVIAVFSTFFYEFSDSWHISLLTLGGTAAIVSTIAYFQRHWNTIP